MRLGLFVFHFWRSSWGCRCPLFLSLHFASHTPPLPSLQFAVHTLHYSKFCTLQLTLSTILKSALCSSHTPQFSSLHFADSHTVCHSLHFAPHALRHSKVSALCSSHSLPFPSVCTLQLTLSAIPCTFQLTLSAIPCTLQLTLSAIPTSDMPVGADTVRPKTSCIGLLVTP